MVQPNLWTDLGFVIFSFFFLEREKSRKRVCGTIFFFFFLFEKKGKEEKRKGKEKKRIKNRLDW